MASVSYTPNNQIDDRTFIIKMTKRLAWPVCIFLVSLNWAIVVLVK